MGGRFLAAKQITRLVVGYELPGLCGDIARYIAEKPDMPFIEHVGLSVELRRDLAELEYGQYLINNDLLTPEAAIGIFQNSFLPKQIENLN